MPTLPLIHWHFNPIALAIGPVAIHWYGLCWASAFLLSEWWARRAARAMGWLQTDVSALIAFALLGTVLGARLGHCLFYDPGYYLAHPLKILAVWEGGLASHGGAMGLIVGLWLGARRFAGGLPLISLLDLAAAPAALGGALIRVANFLNSEIVGLPTRGDWGVVFDTVDALPRHPVQLYEADAYLLIFALLAWLQLGRGGLSRPGWLTGWFMALVFATRVGLEVFKTPQAVYEAGNAITTGQWLSLPFVVLGAVLIWRARRRGQ
jgi:prolipoprotein diacylglyceryl transferase